MTYAHISLYEYIVGLVETTKRQHWSKPTWCGKIAEGANQKKQQQKNKLGPSICTHDSWWFYHHHSNTLIYIYFDNFSWGRNGGSSSRPAHEKYSQTQRLVNGDKDPNDQIFRINGLWLLFLFIPRMANLPLRVCVRAIITCHVKASQKKDIKTTPGVPGPSKIAPPPEKNM